MGSCIADVIPTWQNPSLYAVSMMNVLSSDEDKNYSWFFNNKMLSLYSIFFIKLLETRLELICILILLFAFAEATIIDRQKKSRINLISICNFIN